jgi:mannose-6-phosphate isomerase class I
LDGRCHYQIFSGVFLTDFVGKLKLLSWKVGAGPPWYYLEKYTKFPLVFLFKPFVAMTAFKSGQTQHSLYDLEDESLRSKMSLEVEHYIEVGQFSNN